MQVGIAVAAVLYGVNSPVQGDRTMDKDIVLKYFETNRDYADKKIKEGIEKNRKGDFERLYDRRF